MRMRHLKKIPSLAGARLKKISPHLRLQSSSEGISARENYRYRQTLLSKVRNYWLKGVLEKNLQQQTPLELRLEERQDVVECPWGVAWETTDNPRQLLPSQTKIIDKFQEIGEARSLLLLGEAGSGKTTALLQLLRHFVKSAELDINHPIPVVFNLSSWGTREETITEWLISELYFQYQIPQVIAESWIETQQLLLLLDGLDEVSEEQREGCVECLNEFILDHGLTELVVCCRWRDYESLSNRLRLQKALSLKPLSLQQVKTYLIQTQQQPLIQLLKKDPALRELVTTPLMLHILTQAYADIPTEELARGNSVEESRKHLFNTYIQRMLTRRSRHSPYDFSETKKWLTELAYRMQQQSQTVFHIEKMQPRWLQLRLQDGFKFPFMGKRQRLTPAYRLYHQAVRGSTGILWGLIIGIFTSMMGNSPALVPMVIAGVIASVTIEPNVIQPIQQLKWSWEKMQKSLPVALIIIFAGYASGGIFWALILALGSVAWGGLVSTSTETTTRPNQGIWQSCYNASVFGGIGGIFTVMGLAGWQGGLSLPYGVSISLLSAGLIGFLLAMQKGGNACLRHFILRWISTESGYSPWNYTQFLNYGVERGMLQRVGGGYMFIHRLLQEHFVNLGVTAHSRLSEDPKVAFDYVERGNFQVSLGKVKNAIADYTKAISLEPNLADAYAGRSIARYLMGDYSGVLEDREQVLQLNPTLAQSLCYTAPPLEDSETSLVKVETVAVTVLNDDVNTFNHVIECLCQYIPNMGRDRASELAMQIHHEGEAVVWRGKPELAALYRLQLSEAGLSMAINEQ